MNKTKTKVAILSQSFIVMGILVASTVLANIAQSFPNASLTGIQMIMTLGMIGSFPATLIAGALGAKFDKKKISIVALFIMLIGGLIPTVLNSSIVFLYISSLLIGVGQGILMTNISNISTQLFEGEERSKMYGLQTAFQNGGSVVLMMVAGFIARTGWSNAYLAFLIFVPVILLVMMWLPKNLVTTQEEVKNETSKSKAPVPFAVLLIGVLVCLFCIGYATFSLNISLYVAGMNLGDSAMAALAMSLSTGAGVVGGLVFPPLFKIAKRYVLMLACIVTAIGYGVLVVAPSLATVFVAAICSGIGFALAIPTGIQAISETATPEQMSSSMGSYMAFTSVGAAASPIIINALASLAPSANEGTVFLTSVIFLVALAVISIIWAISTGKKANAIQTKKA